MKITRSQLKGIILEVIDEMKSGFELGTTDIIKNLNELIKGVSYDKKRFLNYIKLCEHIKKLIKIESKEYDRFTVEDVDDIMSEDLTTKKLFKLAKKEDEDMTTIGNFADEIFDIR